MTHGPWTSQIDAYAMWQRFITTPSIDGKRPVAVERRNGELRLLYVRPTDREPAPIACLGIPEYVAL